MKGHSACNKPAAKGPDLNCRQLATAGAAVVVGTAGTTPKLYLGFYGKPISQLRDVTCHMESHSVTCHPTQVNVPRLNPSQ